MKILHTSDWHIGRTFHGHSTLEHLRVVLEAMVAVVAEHGVDVVLVAGDIFDSATPAAENYRVLSEVLRGIRDAGATVIMTSGNHDSATRLGFQSEFAQLAGIHILTRQEQHTEPITLTDEYGPVHFYGIPYLEPSLIRHHYPDAQLRTHEQVLSFVMRRIRADMATRGGRAVVLSHCFAVDVAPAALLPGAVQPGAVQAGDQASDVQASDVERDITAGGLDYVPLSTFAGPDYVALGHIHGRATLSEKVRYSGAPLHYSFSEANKPRGAWLVDLGDADTAVHWVELPVPRRLSVLTGTLDELVGDDSYRRYESDWVSAILTDRVRPMDAMRRLQERFPFCAALEHRPVLSAIATTTYAARVKSKTDTEIVGGFLEFVRNGVGPTDFERVLIDDALAEQSVKDAVQ